MVDALRLYARYLGISIRGQMQYRASFVLGTIGQFLVTGIEFLGLWALFDRFGSLRSWTLPEVALFYAVVNVGFAIGNMLSTGFDRFSVFVRLGEFDRLLLRPRSTVLQLAGLDFAMRRIGRLVLGALVMAWALANLDVDWSAAKVLLLLVAIVGGCCLFFGLFVLQATIVFYTVESLELMNTMTYGGLQTAQYPLSIYSGAFRHFFTFVVPLGCAAYFPVVAVLDRPDPLGTPLWFQWGAPLLCGLFLWVSLGIWRLGVRSYTSTGS